MRSLKKLTFQQWIVGSATSLVVLLTVIYLVMVFGQFRDTARQSALERFELVAQRVGENLQQLLDNQTRRVQSAAAHDLPALLGQRQVSVEDILLTLRRSVLAYPEIYGEYLGLPDGQFIQAIAVRENPQVVAALQAPSASWTATRHIRIDAAGDRWARWHFYDQAGALLLERQEPTSFNPAGRPWYVGARHSPSVYVSAPYVFASTQREGLTVAATTPSGTGVVGFDISLHTLQPIIDGLTTSPNAVVMVLDHQGRVVTAKGWGRESSVVADALPSLTELTHTRWPALAEELHRMTNGARLARFGHEDVVLARHALTSDGASSYQVVTWAPVSDFTAAVDEARREIVLATGLLLLVLIPLAILGTRGISQSLERMAQDSERLRRFDFSQDPQPLHSFLYEVDTLADAQVVMHQSIKARTAELEVAQAKLAKLVEIGIVLGRERDREQMLRKALYGARDIAHAQAATLLLKTEQNTLRFAMRTSDDPLPTLELPLVDIHGQGLHQYVATHVVLSGETVVIDDIYAETRFDVSGTKAFSEESGMRVVSMLSVPLHAGDGQALGVIQLMNALDAQGRPVPFDAELVGFVEALAAQAAVALENRRLLDAQLALMDSMIQILAGAIDTKSPYTGGHCERVPELAIMLAQEACEVQEGPLADFRFKNEDEWREFRIGAWLHDCGKVTTPEYVVDKATKLETIYNRIHEVRMRFEVLLRDAMIERLLAIHEQGMAPDEAERHFQTRRARLVDDFAFVAECNLGGEFMAPERIERLRQIAQTLWTRHFDDRLGLSHEELKRHERAPAVPLPAQERLLADQPHHLFERPPSKALDERYGFRLKVPEYLYNHGEVYNLSVSRGTLTEEERFKINEHIIQTIVMLESMPLPLNLKRVPEYAGTHHETLTGTGYPRQLKAEHLSVPARIMAIADIFEALTASDRPYKKAKTLSESIKILSFFKKDGHIDPVLFDLFLTSGVYRTYAERFLDPEQIDEVDIQAYLG
jgi:HD-GYP domain-containing protein (c-di-GMP phosphodiesterase class II)